MVGQQVLTALLSRAGHGSRRRGHSGGHGPGPALVGLLVQEVTGGEK